MSAPSADRLRFILESGILAPSADNWHRLRFEACGDVLKVWATEGRLAAAGGYKRALDLLSLGAVSENLVIAASRFGIQGRREPFPDPVRPDLVFQVTWLPDKIEPDPLWEMISVRHTNRRLVFHGPRLGPDDLAMLARTAGAVPHCRLDWIDEAPLRRQVLRLMRGAEAERFHNRLMHEELFSAIRFDIGWKRSCEEGLPPGALEIEPPLRSAFGLLRHWPLMRVINLLGADRLLGWRAGDLPARLSPHLGIISVDKTDDPVVFNAGQALQRVWLVITRRGLVLQPMPASALYALAGAQREGIPRALQLELQRSWQVIVPGVRPLMVFRAGRAAPPGLTAGRRALQHYFVGLDRHIA